MVFVTNNRELLTEMAQDLKTLEDELETKLDEFMSNSDSSFINTEFDFSEETSTKLSLSDKLRKNKYENEYHEFNRVHSGLNTLMYDIKDLKFKRNLIESASKFDLLDIERIHFGKKGRKYWVLTKQRLIGVNDAVNAILDATIGHERVLEPYIKVKFKSDLNMFFKQSQMIYNQEYGLDELIDGIALYNCRLLPKYTINAEECVESEKRKLKAIHELGSIDELRKLVDAVQQQVLGFYLESGLESIKFEELLKNN